MTTTDLRAALMARKAEIDQLRLDELTRLQRAAVLEDDPADHGRAGV